ncbi:MAG: DUF1989 domain-containing protein [Sulfobacillus sp.]|nr:DUF1989 domain-containing protein [Sulfobacillus sp.]
MDPVWRYIVRPGGKWSGIIRRGMQMRFTAMGQGANLAVLLYHARNPLERYNMPDTLKAQHTVFLTRGNVLMSDNGRVLASMIEDRVGWHDTISGYSDRHQIDEQYGLTTFQTHRNDWLRSGQENFAVELVRHGLSLRDLVPPVNLFAKVTVDETGQMIFHPHHASEGAEVCLRTEMDVLMVLSNTPNPLDRRTVYPSVPIALEVSPASPVTDEDFCVTYCPENRRAFENTWDYYRLQEIV